MRSYIFIVTATALLYFVLILPAFEVQAAPAVGGPLCGITGTVESVEFERSESEFLGQPITNEYYEVSLSPKTIHLPATSSLEAYADMLGRSVDELTTKVVEPATEPSVCTNAYGSRDAYDEGDHEFIYSEEYIYPTERHAKQPIREGQEITALIEAGGDEALLGIFLSGVVVLEEASVSLEENDQSEDGEEMENTERRTLQMRIIDLLNQLLSLLSLRS